MIDSSPMTTAGYRSQCLDAYSPHLHRPEAFIFPSRTIFSKMGIHDDRSSLQKKHLRAVCSLFDNRVARTSPRPMIKSKPYLNHKLTMQDQENIPIDLLDTISSSPSKKSPKLPVFNPKKQQQQEVRQDENSSPFPGSPMQIDEISGELKLLKTPAETTPRFTLYDDHDSFSLLSEPDTSLDSINSPLNCRLNARKKRSSGEELMRSKSMFAASPVNSSINYCPNPLTLQPSHNTNTKKFQIPSFQVKTDSLLRIDCDTLVSLLNGKYSEFIDHVLIVDCRFKYEYAGGHIQGSVNLNTMQAVTLELLEKNKPEATTSQTLAESDLQCLVPNGAQPNSEKSNSNRQIVVFHCEYSQHRAPRLALHLRNIDRKMNHGQYPRLSYPDIYILHGGYAQFFNRYKALCGGYVCMDDAAHRSVRGKELHTFRRASKFCRAQSYTIGQDSSSSSLSNKGLVRSSASFMDSLSQSK